MTNKSIHIQDAISKSKSVKHQSYMAANLKLRLSYFIEHEFNILKTQINQ